jgi:hypothetical protein
MRATIPVPFASAVLCLLLSAACANRGMHPPTDGGSPGAAGTNAAAGRGGAGGAAGTGGRAAGGTTGTGASGGMDAGCNGPNPNPVDAGACAAKFNFESGIQGAALATNQAAFTSATLSGTDTFCGVGALAIAASFSGTSGTTTKGEVDLPIAAAEMDFTGKTVTVHFTAVPGCSADLGIAIALLTNEGQQIIIPTFRPVGNSWTTKSAPATADAGVTSVMQISIQAFSSTGYQGTIYIDEVDVTGP